MVAKLLLAICLVHYFQPSEMGLYGVMTAAVAYALFFFGAEFYNYTLRALVDASPVEQATIIRDQFVLYAILFILMLPLLYFLFYANFLPVSLCFSFMILVALEHISNELMRAHVVMSSPLLVSIVFFVRQGLWIFILLPIFYFFPANRDFSLVFIAWILGAALSVLIAVAGLLHLPWKSVWRQPIQWKKIGQGLKISQPFMITAFCALSLLYIERFFVNHYCGLEAVGIYTFYASLSLSLHSLISAGVSRIRLGQLLATWKQNDRVQFHNELVYMLKYTIIFVLIFSALSVGLIYPFVKLINKTVYLSNISIFYFLLFGAACRCIADVPLYTLYAQHSDLLLLRINLTAFAIMIAGNAFLVPQYGLMGAALSSAGASLALLGYSLFVMIQRILRPFPLLQS